MPRVIALLRMCTWCIACRFFITDAPVTDSSHTLKLLWVSSHEQQALCAWFCDACFHIDMRDSQHIFCHVWNKIYLTGQWHTICQPWQKCECNAWRTTVCSVSEQQTAIKCSVAYEHAKLHKPVHHNFQVNPATSWYWMITLQIWSSLVGKLRVASRLPSVGWHMFEPSVRLPLNVVNYSVSCCLPCLLQPCYSSPESLQLGSDRRLRYKSSGGKSWLKSRHTSKSCHKPLDTQLKSLTRYAISRLCPKMRIIMHSNGAWWCGQQKSETVAANNFGVHRL